MKDCYPILITPSDNMYVVYIPDFTINTEGYTLTDAIEMARDAIGLMGIEYEDSGKPIPAGSSLASVEGEEGDIKTLVDVDFTEYRRQNDQRVVKKNCTIPSWLCYKAEQAGINFSQVLQKALKEELKI